MKRIRMRTVTVYALAALAGTLLLRTSQSVQIAEDKLSQLDTAISQEQDSIRLLNAEWAFLNNPERLEKLAGRYLDLMPPQPAAIIYESENIPARFAETPSAGPPQTLTPQNVSFQVSPPKSKPPQKYAKLLKKPKAGNQ